MPSSSSAHTVVPDFASARLRRHRLAAVVTAFAVVAGIGVVVSAGTSSAAPVFGPNLLDNSGFGGTMDGWASPRRKAIAFEQVDGGAYNSRHSGRLFTAKQVTARVDDKAVDYPTASGGVTYVASAHVRTPRPFVTGELRIREWSGDRVLNTERTTFSVRSTDWERFTVSSVATDDGSRLQVSVIFADLPSGTPVRVDHVTLQEVIDSGNGDVSQPPVDTTDPDDPTVSPTTTSTSQPTATAGPSATQQASGTLFGASVYDGGTTWTKALANSNSRYGGMDVVRVFYPGLPSPWPGRAGEVGGPIVVSFKGTPADVNSGKYDGQLTQWFATAPRDRDIWWAYWHEPEDDVEAGHFTAAEWRTAYRRIAGMAAKADNPRLHNTVILMCWTVNPNSGRAFGDFFPGADVVETLGWDCYSHPSDPTTYARPADMYARAIAVSAQRGVSFGIAETGSRLASGDDGTKRGSWLREVGRYLADQNASWVTYFDSIVGGEFRLLDEPSRQAWYDVVTRY